MSFWKNWKLTFHIKYLVEEGNLWNFAHVVSHLNCSRSITGTSASTLLPLNSPSPTPRLTHLKHWSATSLIISPKLKTLSKWLFTSERMCPLSIHPNGRLQTHLISTFWCPRATSCCSSPWKLPSVSAQGHNSSSLFSLECYFPILPCGNSFSHSKSYTTGFFLRETFPWALSRMFYSICASTGHFLGLCPELISPVFLGN